jgi:metallophosphoesterase superfamily enzyme
MKKIIHLSDIHTGFEDLCRRFGELVGFLIFTKEPAEDYVVVMTGDIVHHASKDSDAQAVERIDGLKDSGFQVLCVPGDHDGTTSTASGASRGFTTVALRRESSVAPRLYGS